MDFDNSEFIKDFLEEAYEKIEIINDNLLNLEKNPEDENILNEIFRAAHTVKGSAGTMGFESVQNVMHKIENIFDELRKKNLEFSINLNDMLFKGMDAINEMITNIENSSEEGIEVDEITTELESFLSDGSGEKKVQVNDENKDDVDISIKLSDIELDIMKQTEKQNGKIYVLTIYFSEDSMMPSVGRFLVMQEVRNNSEIIKTIPDEQELNKDEFIPYVKILVGLKSSIEDIQEKVKIPNEVIKVDIDDFEIETKDNKDDKKTDVEDLKKEKKKIIDKNKTKEKKDIINSLRVDSVKIDELLNLIGEQIINTSRYFRLEDECEKILQKGKRFSNIIKDIEDELPEESIEVYSCLMRSMRELSEEFKEINQMTRRLNNEMQQNTMKIRMLPVEKVFKRFPRMIRDISKELGKDIELIIEGQETELDKTVIEVLGDPLVHIIRNALDHGIESKEERLKAGKDPVGSIRLTASHQGNRIIIEVSDDGKGLDRNSIIKKAVEKGLIEKESKDLMKDSDVFSLIFEPGFSTAASVTGLSGRGVGMDVVKRSIEKVNGSVEVHSEKGKGTRVIIFLPLTMAIINALLIRGLDQVFSIPLNLVEETIKLKKADIYNLKNTKATKIRDEVVSLISIEELFNIPSKERDSFFVVIVEAAGKKVGIVVDKLYGEQEVVIKNLDSYLVKTPGVAGANILGDGRVSIILDINKLIKRVSND
ncbi:MAG: hypothetical protein C0601_01405 [Candidatus Muiribacterium halophilum]|uniref:Chemotaxis protein CheA n=1 Tax=Muiribacterium halophilum TaxID=2053465 RepID=A0A2N5ZLI1_MUIH1|nr:MAG: hypothetical protein C0601_01405 [Candidatus Muirbacterium halophilum]